MIMLHRIFHRAGKVVTRACFKQKWMWVRLRWVSYPEGISVRGDSVRIVAPKLPWPTAWSEAVRAGSTEGTSLLPLWSRGDVTVR